MNAGGREQFDPAGELDAYVDGQMTPPQRRAFEARLASDPSLSAGLEAQRRLDRSLRGLFVAPPFIGLPTNGHPTPVSPAESAVATAAAAGAPVAKSAASTAAKLFLSSRGLLMSGLIAAAVVAVSWLAYTSRADRRRSFDDVYRELAQSPAVQACHDGNNVETACAITLGRSVKMKQETPGVTVLEVSERPVLSKRTIVVRAQVDGRDVVLFADHALNDSPAAVKQAFKGGAGDLRLFRRESNGVVLYEVTPLDRPRLLDQYECAPGFCAETQPSN